MDKKKLAVIHIVKKELNLSDPEYRKILRDAAGVESAKDLDDEKFRKLMNVFMRSRHYRQHPDGITLRQKYYIRNLFKDLNWDQDHQTNFLKKYYQQKELDQLTRKQASHVIAGLQNILHHES